MDLIKAIRSGDSNYAINLIRNGSAPNINSADPRYGGVTPLTIAAEEGLVEVVRILLEIGASPDAGGVEPPLAAAASNGHLEVVDLLISVGAEINALAEEKTTPLMCAAAAGHLDVVKSLVASGAKIDAADRDRQTALVIAAYSGKREVYDYLHPLSSPVRRKQGEQALRDYLARRQDPGNPTEI